MYRFTNLYVDYNNDRKSPSTLGGHIEQRRWVGELQPRHGLE